MGHKRKRKDLVRAKGKDEQSTRTNNVRWTIVRFLSYTVTIQIFIIHT